MPNYTSQYMGEQIDEAVGKVLSISSSASQVDRSIAKTEATGDYVTERTTVSGWTIHKWNSGLVEMWKQDTVTVDVNIATGALFCSREITATLPSNVLGSLLNIDVRPIGGSNYLLSSQMTEASATSGIFKFNLVSSWSHTSEGRSIWYHVGGWSK